MIARGVRRHDVAPACALALGAITPEPRAVPGARYSGLYRRMRSRTGGGRMSFSSATRRPGGYVATMQPDVALVQASAWSRAPRRCQLKQYCQPKHYCQSKHCCQLKDRMLEQLSGGAGVMHGVQELGVKVYRGTSPTRKRTPLELYRRPVPRVLGGF